MKNVGLALLFIVGAFLALTANFQLSIGAFLMALSYTEFRRIGLDISQVDDILLEKLREVISKGTKNEQMRK